MLSRFDSHRCHKLANKQAPPHPYTHVPEQQTKRRRRRSEKTKKDAINTTLGSGAPLHFPLRLLHRSQTPECHSLSAGIAPIETPFPPPPPNLLPTSPLNLSLWLTINPPPTVKATRAAVDSVLPPPSVSASLPPLRSPSLELPSWEVCACDAVTVQPLSCAAH